MKNLPGAHARRMSLLALALFAATAAPAQDRPAYRDPAAPIEQRVEDLLARMTQDEKIAQLTTIWTQKKQLFDSAGRFDPAAARRLYPAGIGHFARPADLQGPGNPLKTPYRDVRQTIELTNAIQRYARSTRLGIPVLFHEEGLHGYAARGATHFPQAIALASSWDPALLERVFTVAAREIRARGVHLVLAPVVDVGRDPRWGRIEETYGEDPYLVGELGVAAVRGFQGRSLPLAKDRVLATLKHMTGHGQPESGTNVGPANISERTLRETFFPPFRAAVERGNALAVMPSYNEIDGVPSHVNRWLLQDILRGEMGFKGAVVSDYFATELTKQLADYFGVTGGKGVLVTAVTDDGPAAKAGVRAGDVITAVDGEAIDSPGDVSRAINRKKEGDVTLTVVRNKSQQTIRVTPSEGGGFPGTLGRPQVGRSIVIPRIEIPTPEIDIVMPSIVIPSIPSVNVNLPRIRVTPRVIRSERGPI